jgi:isoleucyl-tRNA synthetase
LKPSFRNLGKRGKGKEANALKTDLAKMSADEKLNIHSKLVAKEPVNISGIDLVLEDLEVLFEPKEGFASANSKMGVIILDTTLTPELLERGFVADFKAALQGVRKNAGLELTDKVYLELVNLSDDKQLIVSKYVGKLKKELLASDIVFVEQNNQCNAHKFEVDGQEYWVFVWKDDK